MTTREILEKHGWNISIEQNKYNKLTLKCSHNSDSINGELTYHNCSSVDDAIEYIIFYGAEKLLVNHRYFDFSLEKDIKKYIGAASVRFFHPSDKNPPTSFACMEIIMPNDEKFYVGDFLLGKKNEN